MNLVFTKRNFAMALLVSVFAHFFFMTIVTVVPPEDLFETKPFTRVTFLGPILEKTAFDIMVGGENGVGACGGMLVPPDFVSAELDVKFPEPEFDCGRVPSYSGKMLYARVKTLLIGEKTSPNMFFNRAGGIGSFNSLEAKNSFSSIYEGRSVVHRPPPPSVIGEIAGKGNYFTVVVSAVINSAGNVESPRVSVTSGHLSVDMEALNYFRAWKFQPVEDGKDNEYIETEITVYSVNGGAGNDKT